MQAAVSNGNGRRKSRTGRLRPRYDFSRFKLNLDQSIPQRVAACLLYAREHYPGDTVPFNLIWKVVNARASAPPPRGREVDLLKSALPRVKVLLIEQHQIATVSAPGIGIRCVVDATDALKNALPAPRRRAESANAILLRTAGTIDIDKVPNTPELQPLKKDFRHLTQVVLRQLRDPEFKAALALPPAPSEGEDARG